MFELKKNASLMKNIAYRRYTWKTIAARYEHLVLKVFQGSTSKSLHGIRKAILRKEDFENMGIPHLNHTYHFFENRS
ncbi:MAG: hypothetical protein R2850_09315 [Bacteroidia bacterium]